MLFNIIHGGRPERMRLVQAEVEKIGLSLFFDCELWEGVHDTTSVVKSINLSHKQIVQDAKENYYPEVVILEDDFKATHSNSLKYYLDNKPKDFDIYLGGIYVGDIQPDNTVHTFSALHFYTIHERFYDAFLSLPDNEHIDRLLGGLGKYVVCNPMPFIQHNGIFSSNSQKIEDYTTMLEKYNLYNG